MSKSSGKSKMKTPDSKPESDSESEETSTRVTTNTDPSEAGPSYLEETPTSASTDSAMFGPPTLGDLVNQVVTNLKKQTRGRRHKTMTNIEEKKIVKSDTVAIPYTLQEFIRFFGNYQEGIRQWQRALAYTTNVRLQQALINHEAAYNTARERGLLPVQTEATVTVTQRRIRAIPISAAYIDRIINFLNSILVPQRMRVFSQEGRISNERILIDFRTDYILGMPEVGRTPQNGHIHLTNNLEIDHRGTHVTIDIPSTWISGDGARSMVMHVYRNGRINFKSNVFYQSIRIEDFNLFTGTAIEAANNLQILLNGENEWMPLLAAGGRGRTRISFGTRDPEMNVKKVSDIIENIRNLITYINIFLRIDSPIDIQFVQTRGGTKTKKIKRKLKKQTKNKKSKARKSKQVKRKTRKQ